MLGSVLLSGNEDAKFHSSSSAFLLSFCVDACVAGDDCLGPPRSRREDDGGVARWVCDGPIERGVDVRGLPDINDANGSTGGVAKVAVVGCCGCGDMDGD